MTEKEFIKWLRDFLSGTDIGSLDFNNRYSPLYNHSTILKTIYNKLKELENCQERINEIVIKFFYIFISLFFIK